MHKPYSKLLALASMSAMLLSTGQDVDHISYGLGGHRHRHRPQTQMTPALKKSRKKAKLARKARKRNKK
jgi:hypothetical protein